MNNLKVKTISEFISNGIEPEILFWVGSAGSFDDRAKKITRAFVKILNVAKVDFAVLGEEESCSGDVAKRAGNEFLFQMQALMNIDLMNNCKIFFNSKLSNYELFARNYEDLYNELF